LVDVFPGLPVANYPVTSEVWVGWAVGISRSWVTASVVNVGLAVLAAAGAALGLRAAGASRLAAGLGAGALVALPLLTFQLGGPDTDLATLAWVVVAAGLAAAAARDGNPGLLAVALVAGGLAVGAKTTAALPTAAALLAAAWALRDRLRPALGALAAGAVAAVLVGGLWPLRNLVLHGSPLWPFARGPFGDPLPAALTAVHGSFLSRPGALLDGRVDDYVKTLSGGLLLLAGGLVAPLLRRSRLAVGAGAVTALAVLAWMAAPFTGIDADKFAVGALRYLLPALAAATAALCLAGIGARRGLQRAVVGVLIAALAWSALRTLDLGFPFVPSLGVVVAFVVLGAAGGALAGRLRLGRPAAWLAPALAVVAGGVLAVGADGYVVRHAEGARLDGGVLLALSAQPGYADGDAPVAIGPAVVPLVAGDGLRHRVVRLGTDAPCATVSRQARLGWVALQTTPRAAYERLSGCLAGARPVWSNAKWSLYRGVGG
jgi:hypothetical protein